MLKIKDNVDLKELEKFGFNTKPVNSFDFEDQIVDDYCGYAVRFNPEMTINWKTKKIYSFEWFNYNSNQLSGIDIIYDLIKANLVEKVGNNNE